MVMNPVLKKLHLDEERYVTSEDVKKHCQTFGYDHRNMIRNLMARGYLVRIFRGVFYLKSFDEMKINRLEPSVHELVSKGLELKGISNWYFALQTALKFNNATHEYFTVDHVINDSIQRNKTMDIAGHMFKFTKLKRSLFGFGIMEKDINYSNLEKTVLDIIYLDRYNGVPEAKTVMNMSEYANMVDRKRILDYTSKYPKTVRNTLERII